MRSINTTVISVLPVLALMVIAVWLLGVGTLKDLALVQLVGIVVGAYSSIFFATPLLVTLKEWRGPVAAHTRKVLAKRGAAESRTVPPAGEAVGAHAGATPVSVTKRIGATTTAGAGAAPVAERTPRPGVRPTGKRAKRRH